jgi:hypothetical protein
MHAEMNMSKLLSAKPARGYYELRNQLVDKSSLLAIQAWSSTCRGCTLNFTNINTHRKSKPIAIKICEHTHE